MFLNAESDRCPVALEHFLLHKLEFQKLFLLLPQFPLISRDIKNKCVSWQYLIICFSAAPFLLICTSLNGVYRIIRKDWLSLGAEQNQILSRWVQVSNSITRYIYNKIIPCYYHILLETTEDPVWLNSIQAFILSVTG